MLTIKYGKILQVDDTLLVGQDNTQKRLRALTDYQCALLLAQTDYLKWLSRYLNLQRDWATQQAIVADVEKELMTEYNICEAITACDAIIEITAELTIINNNITNINQDITNLQQTIINVMSNDYPTSPSAGSDAACQAAWYTARQVVAAVIAAWDDAATITLQEFVAGLLGLNGFDGSVLVLWYQWIVATSDPDFVANANASIDDIAQQLYCDGLSLTQFRSNIASLSIDANVKTAITYLLDSDAIVARWAMWVAVGQLTETGNSCVACGLSLVLAKSAVNGVDAGALVGPNTYNSAFTSEGTQQHRIRLVVFNGASPATATINFKFTSGTDSRLVRVNTLAGAAPSYNVVGQGTLLRNQDIVWTIGATYTNSGAQVIEIANQTAFSGVEIWIT
jgi:hypothetical protein